MDNLGHVFTCFLVVFLLSLQMKNFELFCLLVFISEISSFDLGNSWGIIVTKRWIGLGLQNFHRVYFMRSSKPLASAYVVADKHYGVRNGEYQDKGPEYI